MVSATKPAYRIDPPPPAGGAADAAARRDSAELLRRVTAGLAHSVNNALVGVIGYLEMALREAEPGSPLHARLTEGLHCALRAAERVRRMVAFARRPEAGYSAAVCLRRVADEAACRAATEHPDLAVLVHSTEPSCAVRANEPLLHLVLEQLVSNAVEAMPNGGTLILCAWDEGSRRCLSVTDSGEGLGAEARRHLFEPYFTTKSFGHLGLGLSLCRDVVEAQGGALHVTSAEGRGTTVTLSFPPEAGMA
jgi:signal transduction histidine kinase